MAQKVVYAVTSESQDFYSVLTRVSAAALRMSNPDVKIVVASDPQTYHALQSGSDPLLKEIDELIRIETPPGESSFRNRWVKTKLRSAIEGKFLFLDSDTLVKADISEIFAIGADIAGAANHSARLYEEQIWVEDRKAFEAMGWDVHPEIYINGGVIFYNDTDKACAFGEEWHKLWRSSFEKLNRYRDQPALNASLRSAQPELFILDNSYNAQFKVYPSAAKNAKILHYYSANNDETHTAFEAIVKDVLHGGRLTEAAISKLLKSEHPWKNNTILGKILARRLLRQRNYEGFAWDWLRSTGRWQILTGRQ